jgi:hypothetical protein
MAEVIRIFEGLHAQDGQHYRAQVVGRAAGNIWEGWIEFQLPDRDWVHTPRETTQPDRDALVYWAGGLSTTYLEGALARALTPPPAPPPVAVAEPRFAEPAPSVAPTPVVVDRAVLDPFSVGAKGETVLRQELGALRGWHLRNIIRAYDLTDHTADLEVLTEAELIEMIVSAVQPV